LPYNQGRPQGLAWVKTPVIMRITYVQGGSAVR